ncbi:MAG: hypothetical protein JXR76_03955 [Deltaproteobacteria bacterium]|nr:hypothetical protein [Deltaproteobacteria bacterium]
MGEAVLEQEQMELNDMATLALVCRSALLGSWRLQRTSGTITLSQEYCRLLRIPSSAELMLPHDVFCSKYIHPEDNWFVRDYQISPPGRKYSFRAICADGVERWLESFPVQTDNVNREMLSGVVQDITERMAHEDNLRNARKMESIRSIAGGIAHEFNNILYSMAGYLGLVKEMLTDVTTLDMTELADCVGEMEISNQRAVRLIKKIQAFSHSGRHGIAIVDLDRAIDMAVKTAPVYENINVRTALPSEGAVRVYVNEAILVEGLCNIIDNGIAAMEKSGGTLDIRTDIVFAEDNRPAACGTVKTGYYGRVLIRDEGCGMDRNTISRIFEPFYTTKQAGDGTGLGLAIVYGMVNAAGGAVEVESQPGKGTIFKLLLPYCSNQVQGESVQ